MWPIRTPSAASARSDSIRAERISPAWRTRSEPCSAICPGRGGGRLAAGTEPVEPLEDLDRLAAKLGVLAAEVLVGELAGGVVELGVADLAVLGLLLRLEVGHGRVLAGIGAVAAQ